jgi:hypothetical protein
MGVAEDAARALAEVVDVPVHKGMAVFLVLSGLGAIAIHSVARTMPVVTGYVPVLRGAAGTGRVERPL